MVKLILKMEMVEWLGDDHKLVAVAKEGQALSWEELQRYVPNVLSSIDYENGPTISQATLRLFGHDKKDVRITFFRDHHAWCPYSQKVWIWLEEQKVPYRVEKVTMKFYGQKEAWYKRMVPSGLLPAVRLDSQVIPESDDILVRLEKEFGLIGNKHGMMDPEVVPLRQLERKLFDTWMKWLCEPSRSQSDENARQKRYVNVLSVVNAALGRHPGPYFLDEFSVVDVVFAPWIERMNATLFYYKGFKIRFSGDFPNIDRWMDAMETRETYRGSMGDIHTHCHVTPPLFGTCHESGTDEQKACRRLVDEGPFLEVPTCNFPRPRDAAHITLARTIKHKNSYMKQNPHRSGNVDAALRCALTYLITGQKVHPPADSYSSLIYMRDRTSCPRDFPCHSTALLRHVLSETARLIQPHEVPTPIPVKHRLDQEPFAFIKARQETFSTKAGTVTTEDNSKEADQP